MAFTALAALIYSAIEYREHKKREKMMTFTKYSERYSSDENIKVVSKYLIKYLENTNTNEDEPTINNKEMFLRFFEELEFQIEEGCIDRDNIEDFFVYYVIAASMCEPFIADTELAAGKGDKDVWLRYRKLVGMYSKLKDGISDDYIKHHPDSKGLKILIEYPERHCCLERICNKCNN